MNDRNQEIKALIDLLEDPDEDVFKHVEERLISLGEEAMHPLEKGWERSLRTEVQARIESIIRRIQFNSIRKEFKHWYDSDRENLLYGAFLLARVQYPDLDYQTMNQKIEDFTSEIWLELNNHLTALEKIKVINYFLYSVHRFSKSARQSMSPQLFLINHVLDTHRGSAELIGLIYVEIARRLDIPVFGVNLPHHFLLCYHDPTYLEDPDGVLFYINPHNRGNVLGRNELEYFLNQQNMEPLPEHFVPCDNLTIIKRIMEILKYTFFKSGNQDKIEFLDELSDVIRGSGDQTL